MALLALLFCYQPVSAAIASYRHPEAPRTVNYYLRRDIAGKEEILSQWDLLILSYILLDEQPEAIATIRALNPDQITLVYIDPVLIPQDPSDVEGWLDHDLVDGIHPLWLAYTDADHIISFWDNAYHVNITEVCPVEEDKPYRDYFIQFLQERFKPYIEAGVIDGIFLDEMSNGGYLWWQYALPPGEYFDYNMDDDPDADADIEAWLTASMRMFADDLAASVPPGGLLLGNNCKPRHGSLHGKFYESFPATWEGILEGSLHDLDIWNSLTMGESVLSVNGVVPPWDDPYTDPVEFIRAFRFRLTASLLSDNYFSLDYTTEDHYQLTYYDLFDFNLGLPLGQRYTIGESPVATALFEGEIESTVTTAWMADLTLVDEPALVIQGEESLLMDVFHEDPWPALCEINLPEGYQGAQSYVFSFRYKTLATEHEESRLFIKAYTQSGGSGASVESSKAKITGGCQGLYRVALPLEDWDDYRVYLRSKGKVTVVVDSLTVVDGEGGLWARDYEQGLVVCVDTEAEPFTLPYDDTWELVDGDGQHEAYPEWLSGQGITFPDSTLDGLVFRYTGTGVAGDPSAPAPAAIALSEPWPNPGNPAFSVRIRSAGEEPATLTLHDIAGRRVATLWRGTVPGEGLTLSFRSGEPPLAELPSGVYLIRAAGGSESAVRKWVLLR